MFSWFTPSVESTQELCLSKALLFSVVQSSSIGASVLGKQEVWDNVCSFVPCRLVEPFENSFAFHKRKSLLLEKSQLQCQLKDPSVGTCMGQIPCEPPAMSKIIWTSYSPKKSPEVLHVPSVEHCQMCKLYFSAPVLLCRKQPLYGTDLYPIRLDHN